MCSSLCRTTPVTETDTLLPMTNIAVAALPCQHCSGTLQYDGAPATHLRQHSVSDSAPGPSGPQLSLMDLMQVSSTTAGARWSMAREAAEGGSGHHRKGSQESVDFAGSLASDSFCSTIFAGEACIVLLCMWLENMICNGEYANIYVHHVAVPVLQTTRFS
jgi:hypothetical protein